MTNSLWLERTVIALYCLFLGLWPPLVLVRTWYRYGTWRRVIVQSLRVIITVFVIGGCVFGGWTLIVCLFFEPAGPNGYGSGLSLLEYVTMLYVAGGGGSVVAMFVISPLWLSIITIWRLVHPSSLRGLFQRGS